MDTRKERLLDGASRGRSCSEHHEATDDYEHATSINQESTHATEGTPLIQGDNAADVVARNTSRRRQSNALETIQDILSILNLIKEEKTEDLPEGLGYDAGDNSKSIMGNSTQDESNDSADDEFPTEDDDQDFLQMGMPNATGGTTFAYECALRNRIKSPRLSRGGEYDIRAYTPTFVHDCLMLPGALAKLIGKPSSFDIIRRMTPALLPGFHAHVDPETQLPCLLQSQQPGAYVQGIVIFGQATAARDCVHAHYRPYARRVKVQLEVDVLSPHVSTNKWVQIRKKIWAHAWLWSDVGRVDLRWGSVASRWTIEDYLAGTSVGSQALLVGRDGCIGDNYEGDSSEIYDGSACEGQGRWETTETLDMRPGTELVYDGFGSISRDEDWFW